MPRFSRREAQITDSLVASLKVNQMPAIGFVNGKKRGEPMALFVKIRMHLIGELAQTLLSGRTRDSCRENNWLVLMLASFAQNSRTLYFSGSASMRVINHRGAQSPRLVGQ